MAFNGRGASGMYGHWNGTGTISFYDKFNISSLTDFGTGHYRINGAISFDNINYTAIAGCGEFSGYSGGYNPEHIMQVTEFNLSGTRVRCRGTTGGAQDKNSINYIAIGDR